jgi:hypothetical protein
MRPAPPRPISASWISAIASSAARTPSLIAMWTSRFVAACPTVGPRANALDHTAMDSPGGEQRVGRAAVVDGDMVEDLDHPCIRVDLSATTSATHSPTNRALATSRSGTTVPGITQFGSMLPILPVRIGACEGKAHAGRSRRRCKVYT